MSIIEVDKRQLPKQPFRKSQIKWHSKFCRNIYHSNYKKYYKDAAPDIVEEEGKNQSSFYIIKLINDSKNRDLAAMMDNQFQDTQRIASCFSLYSNFIPLEDQSYLNDELVNTFPYLLHLKETSRRDKSMALYDQFKSKFGRGKKEGKQYIALRWQQLKAQYLCQIDSITAVSILIEIMRRSTSIMPLVYQKFGTPCLQQIFMNRIHKAIRYIRSGLKTHHNLKISVQVSDQINQKTLPMVMKTWYCSICLIYDCDKHKLESKLSDNDYHYESIRNKISQQQNIKSIIKLLNSYEKLRNEGDMSILQQKSHIKSCGQQCYQLLVKQNLFKIYRNRYKLISPVAKALLQMGIRMFSYNPCQIHRLLQSKTQTQGINCNQLFIHFVQECDLSQLLNNKMYKSQIEHLTLESGKIFDTKIKFPINPVKLKRMYYLEQRHKNRNPQFAVCMHNFIDCQDDDPKCDKCVCKDRGFCIPACLCGDSCTIPRTGCVCKGLDSCQTEKCICYINKIECDPEICNNCFADRHQKKNCCKNDQILRKLYKKINIGISRIPGAGLGAFAGQKINKNDIISKYTGQHISLQVDFIREAMIKDLSFYNFDSPNGKVIAASIDARFMGNKARFINHENDGHQNLKADNFFSNGTEFIVLYAMKDIPKGEELFFNYDGNGQLYANHREKYPFIKPPRKG